MSQVGKNLFGSYNSDYGWKGSAVSVGAFREMALSYLARSY